MKPYYHIIHKGTKQYMRGLAARKDNFPLWSALWTEDRAQASKFYAITDVKRYIEKPLLDPNEGPYGIVKVEAKS